MVMLRRKEGGNPTEYFDKTFAEYKEGFQSEGKYPLTQTISGVVSQQKIVHCQLQSLVSPKRKLLRFGGRKFE